MTNLTRILLIEDDAADATLLQVALARSYGTYEVKRVSRLAVGLELARSQQYSVILTDLGLPDSEGLRAVEHLRLASPHAAIIVLSGQDNDEIYIDTLSRGADAFLSKRDLGPVTVHRCIQQCIERCKQKAENRTLMQAVQEQKSRMESQALQLADKNQRLEKLCATSQEFVNNVSHEFRTPLCVVKQYASLIADGIVGPITDDQCKMLRVIEGRVDDLNNIVDDMLDISRHESGLLAASRENCDATTILNRILPGLTQRAKLRQIELRCELPDDLPAIFCDPEKVSRTLINLIVNAIKFSSPDTSVTVNVSHCDVQREIMFAVKDSGPGIEPEQREMIFSRFRQVNSTLQSSTKGFGLGLNIAKELVDLNLGTMSLQSVVGEGSTFSFSVPIADSWEVYQRFLNRLSAHRGNRDTRVIAIRATIEPHASSAAIRESHVFLNYLLNSQDLLVPLTSGNWLIVLDAESRELDSFLVTAEQETVQVNRNRPQGPLPEIQLALEAEFDLKDGLESLKNLFDGSKQFSNGELTVAQPLNAITQSKSYAH